MSLQSKILPDYLQERGVFYTHKRCHPHDWRFSYTRRRTVAGQEDTLDIFIHSGCTRVEAERDFYKLLDYWNRDEGWRYHAVI